MNMKSDIAEWNAAEGEIRELSVDEAEATNGGFFLLGFKLKLIKSLFSFGGHRGGCGCGY